VVALGEEVSFEQADIKELIVSSGDPNPLSLGGEQTGKGLWVFKSGVTLRNARIGTVTFKNVSVKGIADLRGVTFGGGKDSVRFLNADFAEFRLDSWPVGVVLATPETRERLVSALQAAGNTTAARAAFFDLLPVSENYRRWLAEGSGRRPSSYDGYLGYRLLRFMLQPFWVTSAYGTSIARTVLSGIALTLLFGVVFLVLDRGRGQLVRIEKALEFKTRLSETPVLSFGEKSIERGGADEEEVVGPRRQTIAAVLAWFESARLAFGLSVNTVAKIGFGNIRVRAAGGGSLLLVRLAWTAWAVGYGWYLLLIYTVSVIPILKGLF
jgi:hypothetical protein